MFFLYLDHTIYSVKADGTDLRQIFKEKERYHRNYDPDVSPVGTDIVYTTMRHAVQRRVARNYDIEVSSLSGNSRQRVTSGAEQDIAPAWSPRVDRIAFVKTPNRLLDLLGLYTIALDGTREREVVSFFPRRATSQGTKRYMTETLCPDRSGVPRETCWPT